jgi:putative addiction module component (TIGR02574 family)
MNERTLADHLRDLSVVDRLKLIEEVWDSLERPEDLPVPNWHRAELDARLDAHKGNPGAAKTWPEIKDEIIRSLGK